MLSQLTLSIVELPVDLLTQQHPPLWLVQHLADSDTLTVHLHHLLNSPALLLVKSSSSTKNLGADLTADKTQERFHGNSSSSKLYCEVSKGCR